MDEEIIRYNYRKTITGHEVSFKVEGTPIPQGSMTAYPSKNGKIRMVHNKAIYLTLWREKIGSCFKKIIYDKGNIFEGDNTLTLYVSFYFHAPNSRRKDFSRYPSLLMPRVVKPDLDKLIRAVGDSFTLSTGVDDSKIWDISGRKFEVSEGEEERVDIDMYIESISAVRKRAIEHYEMSDKDHV